MWVQHGCRGIFSCAGQEVRCGVTGAVGFSRQRCECWYDSSAQASGIINMSNGGWTKQGIFNLAYTWSTATHTWWALGRFMQGGGHLAQCWRKKEQPVNYSHFLAFSSDAQQKHGKYIRVAVPSNTVCDNVGECGRPPPRTQLAWWSLRLCVHSSRMGGRSAKHLAWTALSRTYRPRWVTEPHMRLLLDGSSGHKLARGAALAPNLRHGVPTVYCHAHGDCTASRNGWRNALPAGRRHDMLMGSQFINYLFALPTTEESESTADATLLSYTTTPDPDDASAKNFLFFSLGRAERHGAPHDSAQSLAEGRERATLYVITLIEPHVIYSLDRLRGHERVAQMEPAYSTAVSLGFGSHLRLSLSGGPLRVDQSTFVVAGHTAAGGWWNAQRHAPPVPRRTAPLLSCTMGMPSRASMVLPCHPRCAPPRKTCEPPVLRRGFTWSVPLVPHLWQADLFLCFRRCTAVCDPLCNRTDVVWVLEERASARVRHTRRVARWSHLRVARYRQLVRLSAGLTVAHCHRTFAAP